LFLSLGWVCFGVLGVIALNGLFLGGLKKSFLLGLGFVSTFYGVVKRGWGVVGVACLVCALLLFCPGYLFGFFWLLVRRVVDGVCGYMGLLVLGPLFLLGKVLPWVGGVLWGFYPYRRTARGLTFFWVFFFPGVPKE